MLSLVFPLKISRNMSTRLSGLRDKDIQEQQLVAEMCFRVLHYHSG
jgi:hypothetical protein